MTTPDTTNDEVERLSAKFHGIYQAEAKRQGDVRHKDAYADLPENVKEFDRVLAREVIRMMVQVRLEETKWWEHYAKHTRKMAEAELKRVKERKP